MHDQSAAWHQVILLCCIVCTIVVQVFWTNWQSNHGVQVLSLQFSIGVTEFFDKSFSLMMQV